MGPDHRHVVDQSGAPFLIHGDTPWSLISGLTKDEAEQYLENRRQKGFNSIIVNLIEPVKWSSLDADVKGDIYEGLLARSAEESPKGAGQYFTPRELIKAIVDCVQPTADDTVCDPAAGTGGFLLSAYDYVVKHQGKTLDKDRKKHLRTKFVKGWELVPNTGRLPRTSASSWAAPASRGRPSAATSPRASRSEKPATTCDISGTSGASAG